MTDENQEPQTTNRAGKSDCLPRFVRDAVPVFATEEDAQKFRDEYSAEMEPILREQRKARALSELDARYLPRRELKSARLVIDGETATISQILDEADASLGNILRTTRLGKRADRGQPKTQETTMESKTQDNAASGPNCQRRFVRLAFAMVVMPIVAAMMWVARPKAIMGRWVEYLENGDVQSYVLYYVVLATSAIGWMTIWGWLL